MGGSLHDPAQHESLKEPQVDVVMKWTKDLPLAGSFSCTQRRLGYSFRTLTHRDGDKCRHPQRERFPGPQPAFPRRFQYARRVIPR